jgi:glucose/arabinose dehydrogenase
VGTGVASSFDGLANVIQEGRSRIAHGAYAGSGFEAYCLLRKKRDDPDSTYQVVGSSDQPAAGTIQDGQRPTKGLDYLFRTDVVTVSGHLPGANTVGARGAGSIADVEGWAQLEQSCFQCGSSSVQGGSLRSTIEGDGGGGADDTVGEIAVYKDRVALGTHPVDPNTIVTARVLSPLSPTTPGAHLAAQLNLSVDHPAAVRDDAAGTVADLMGSAQPWITVELRVTEDGSLRVVAKDSAASSPDKIIAQSGDLLVDGPINNVYLTVQIVDPATPGGPLRYEVRYKPNTADPDVDQVLFTNRELPGAMPTAWLSLDAEMTRFEDAVHDVRFDEVEAVYQTNYEALPDETFGGLPSNVQVPPGFQTTEVAHALDGPTAIDFADNGDMYVAERNGKVKRLTPGAAPTGATEVLDIQDLVNSGPNDQGLTGLVLDPAFGTNGFFYVYYTVQKADTFGDRTVSRVERFHVVGGTADRTDPLRKTLVGSAAAAPGTGDTCPPSTTSDCLPSDAYTHSSGGLAFGADGMLWVSTPDGASPEGPGTGGTDPLALRAIDPNSLAGKLLRVDPVTGAGVPGNPGYSVGSPSSPLSRTWAQGFRNPFRIAQRPAQTQSWYSTDVGWGAFEELNLVPGPSAGPKSVASFAWPCLEGPDPSPYNTLFTGAGQCPVASPVAPLHYYDSSGVDHAIIGSAFYTGSAFPSPWSATGTDAAFYYSDYPSGEITMVKTNATDQKLAVERFAGGFTGPVMLAEGPADPTIPGGERALYVVNLGPLDTPGGKIWRISYPVP